MAELLNSKFDFNNYVRLQIIVRKCHEPLRDLFIKQWNATGGKIKWEDSCTNRSDFINGPGKRLFENSTDIKQEFMKSRSTKEWDVSLLIQAITCLNSDHPSKSLFKRLESLQKNFRDLELEVSNKDFNMYWKQISSLLIQLNLPKKEIDAIRTMPIESESMEQNILDSDIKMLKDSGNVAFKEGSFARAVKCYTDAIFMPNASSKEVAVLYSNRSAALLKLGYISNAKEDALTVVHLYPTWWKGYCRLAFIYKADEEYKLALKNFLLCRHFHNAKKLDDEIILCLELINHEKNMDIYFNRLKQSGNGIRSLTFTMIFAEGMKYYTGTDVPLDYNEAADYFYRAAPGSAEALFCLAKMYANGEGVPSDFNKSIRLLKEAAKKPILVRQDDGSFFAFMGVTAALQALGQAYEQGIRVMKNYDKARFWYEKAIKNWSGLSANSVGIMYANGLGVPKSINLAIQYWKLGAGMKNVECMESLVHTYFQLEDFESMQKWCLYAAEHKSKLGLIVKFKKHFQERITKNFKPKEFATSLWLEIESGPLKHLIYKELKDYIFGDENWKKCESTFLSNRFSFGGKSSF